jgi:hypothetical protein
MQTRVMLAAKRSIQLLHNALLTGYQAYSPTQIRKGRAVGDKRGQDRRLAYQAVGFPDRRFNERRGRSRRAVA